MLSVTTPRQPLSSFATLGELLKFLRRRARLSQRELSIAVGYSESHISRLETNDRAIDRASLLALFVPALRLQNEPEMVDRLLALCGHRAEAGVGASADDPASLPPQNARLPTQLSSFVGRADELVELGRRLRNPDVRLLTLTGVGGCGKTRLALRLGQELAPLYVDGVYLIELATVTDALLLPQAAALALGLHDPTDRYDFALVSTALRSRHCPLVLDNCEHLLDAAAAFCALLLSASPALQIVATSRERVGIPGEIVFGVQPLALPPLSRGGRQRRADVERFDAIQLFVERACATPHSFDLTDDNATALARICRHLDGIPLGIELAAAWVNLLTPEQIADRIDADLDLLTNANRTVLPRHQTMHAALEWSYLLLSDLEQQLLRRLSVFIGDWNLAPAEAVTAVRGTDGATVKGIPFLTLISRLANKSLVTVDRLSESEAHYRLLEPIRAYALEKLRAAGEEISARNGHLSYYVVLAERLDGEFEQHIGRADIACLDRETENLRAALAWSLKSGRFEDGLRLAIALGRYWRHRGRHVEGRRWLEALLESSPEPTPLRAQTLLWAGILARRQGDMHVARTFCDDSLMLLRSWDDQISVAIALENMAWTYLDEDRERALAYFDESLALFRRLGRKRQVGRLLTTTAQMLREDARFSQATANLREALSLLRTADDPIGTAQALNGLAELASLRGEYVQAGELLTKSLELVRAVGSKHDLAWVQCGLAENCWHRGEFPAAIEHAKASQLLFEELESVKGMAVASHHAGLILTSQDDLAQAVHEYHQSMRLCRRINERFMLARCLAGLGAVAYKRDDIDLAGTLLFVATTELEQRPDQLTSADLSFYREVLNHCRARLGVELCVALEAHVQELPIDRCASEMLGDMP